MSRVRARSEAALPSARRISVLVCRGCCCGTTWKHPEVEHAAQLSTLRAAVSGVSGARLWTVDCLGPCDRSNVVVVRAEGQRRWFGGVSSEAAVGVLAGWISSGAATPPPSSLARLLFLPDQLVAAAIMVPHKGRDLFDWMLGAMTRGGLWTMGVHGASAEFDSVGAVIEAAESTCAATAVTARGALRLKVNEETRAFVIDRVDQPGRPYAVLLATSGQGTDLSNGIDNEARIAILGPDAAAIRPDRRSDTLIDLGIGRRAASFLLRTQDRGVLDRVGELQALDWREHLEQLGAEVEAVAADRVVQTRIGRIEVYAATKAQSWLRPGELELDLDCPPGVELPPGYTIGAIHYPVAG